MKRPLAETSRDITKEDAGTSKSKHRNHEVKDLAKISKRRKSKHKVEKLKVKHTMAGECWLQDTVRVHFATIINSFVLNFCYTKPHLASASNYGVKLCSQQSKQRLKDSKRLVSNLVKINDRSYNGVMPQSVAKKIKKHKKEKGKITKSTQRSTKAVDMPVQIPPDTEYEKKYG